MNKIPNRKAICDTLMEAVKEDKDIVVLCSDSREQAAYEKFEREMLLEVDEATLDAGSAAVLSGKLLQFCNGAVYDNDKNAVEVHGEKLEAFKEIVEGSQGKPILVFYNFQHDKSFCF